MGSRGLTRGDIVRVATGKPRPAVVVQSDRLSTPVEILLCPFSSVLVDAPLYRIDVKPSMANGLNAHSQLMVDKVGPAPRDRIGGVIGRLNPDEMARLDAALIAILALAG